MERDIEILEQQAIEAAMESDWDKAITLNKKIVKINKEDISAFQRMGYAYLQKNKLKEASMQYKKALKIQPKNNIAEDHLEKIAILLEKKKKRHVRPIKYDPNLFLDIPGKTRTVHLVKLGQKEDLAGLNIGEEVILKEKRRKIETRSRGDEYIGCLPDDISKRLSYFIKKGSQYRAYINEVDLTDVVLFIAEVSKGKKVRNYPSFPSNPHVMLSDIHHLTAGDGSEELEDQAQIDGEEDEIQTDIGLDDSQWEKYENQKDLSAIVQIEDDDEDEE